MKNSFLAFRRTVEGLIRLFPYFRIRRLTIAQIICLTLLAAALEGAGVGLLLPMLELLRNNEVQQPMKAVQLLMDWLPGRNYSFYISLLCFGVIGAIALKNLFLYLCSRIVAELRATAQLNLRAKIFDRLQNSDLEVIEKSTSGEMANAILLESGRTAYAIEFLIFLLQRVLITFFYVVALVVISWQLSILAGLLSLACGLALGYFYKILVRSGRDIGKSGERVNSHLNEMLMGTRLIRTTNSQQRENDRFYEINKEFSTLLAESAKAGAALTPITETLGVVGGMAIVASAAVFLVNPGYMKGDMLLGFAFVLLRLLPAVNMVYGLYGQTISLAGGIEQSERWLKVDQFPRRPFGKVAFTGFNRGLRLQNLTFDYPNGHRALKNVSFEIKYGEVTALVGGSGSGKTTIASLLLRLRQPTEGCILVDGQDYWDFTPESWHRNVAIVEQDAFLFSGTLYENVCYGLSGVSEDEVKLAIRRAHLEHVVDNMPDGLHTLIGERGVMLSGGQRQRLSIARALVRNPKLLILDEATSALDSISESQVQAALDEAAEGRSVLVIAHRFSTVRRAHKIVVMENGQLAEQGSWQELENRDGAFRRLLSASPKALI